MNPLAERVSLSQAPDTDPLLNPVFVEGLEVRGGAQGWPGIFKLAKQFG